MESGYGKACGWAAAGYGEGVAADRPKRFRGAGLLGLGILLGLLLAFVIFVLLLDPS